MHQEAVSPRSWGPGDTGDKSPRQVLFCTEPPPPISPPCDECATTSGTKLQSSSCPGSRTTRTLPGPVSHPLLMPVEPAAGLATAGTMGHLCLSSGHGCCPDRHPPPSILPTPGPSASCPAPCYLRAASGWLPAHPASGVQTGVALGEPRIHSVTHLNICI